MTKRKKLIILKGCILLSVVVLSMVLGANAKGLSAAIAPKLCTMNEFDVENLELQDYLLNNEFHDVQVNFYECFNEDLKKKGYTKNETCPMSGFFDGKEIYINSEKADSDEKILRVMFHEYGHYIWFRIMSDSDRVRYQDVYTSSAVFVSEYALEGGIEEDFAETYEAWKIGFTGTPETKIRFFRELVLKYPNQI